MAEEPLPRPASDLTLPEMLPITALEDGDEMSSPKEILNIDSLTIGSFRT